MNSTLEELYLNGNAIGDDGARHLMAALKSNKCLEVLSLQVGRWVVLVRRVLHIMAALESNKWMGIVLNLLNLQVDGNCAGVMCVHAVPNGVAEEQWVLVHALKSRVSTYVTLPPPGDVQHRSPTCHLGHKSRNAPLQGCNALPIAGF